MGYEKSKFAYINNIMKIIENKSNRKLLAVDIFYVHKHR